MRNLFFLTMYLLVGCRGSHEKFKDSNPVTIYNYAVSINYYEDDSLNKARPYALPVMYFDFVATNPSDSLFNLVLNTFKEKETPRLFAVFLLEGKRDTLMLTDFESFKINKIRAQDTTRFTVSGYIPHLLDKGIEDLSTINLMKTIAETGQIYYSPNNLDQELIKEGFLLTDTLHIKKSKDFTILYRDPDDTTIE